MVFELAGGGVDFGGDNFGFGTGDLMMGPGVVGESEEGKRFERENVRPR